MSIRKWFKKKLRKIRRIIMSENNKPKVEKKLVGENQLLINEKVMNKLSVVTHLSEWVRNVFIFQRGDIHLPEEKPLPVNNVDEELVKLSNFRGTGLKALEYLVLVVLAIGIKIGREMERNDRIDREED